MTQKKKKKKKKRKVNSQNQGTTKNVKKQKQINSVTSNFEIMEVDDSVNKLESIGSELVSEEEAANHCKIKRIEINDCSEIVDFRAGNNLLTDLDFLKNLNSKKLSILSVHSNDLGKREELDLKCFSEFENLESLFIDNVSENKINQNIYNRFHGSLKPLQGLVKLKELSISNTDVDSELDELESFLNSLGSLEKISCSSSKKSDSRVKNLAENLNILKEKRGWDFEKEVGCKGVFDLESKGKKREDIEELDISGEELEGKLNLNGFKKLKYLICRSNKLTEIDLTDCLELIGIDCTKNKLEKITFGNQEGKKVNLKEFRGSENKFPNLKEILQNINPEALAYFDINNNAISNTAIGEFNQFSNLENLYIGSTEKEKKENPQNQNHFTGQLEDLNKLKKLLEIDIRNNGTGIKDNFLSLKKDKKLLEKLEKVYSDKFSEEQLKNETAEHEDSLLSLRKYYSKEDGFYDVKAEDKNYRINKKNDDYTPKEHYKDVKLIYPSELETEFG
ncbi:hypothetical protein C1645_743200 [Glomus cerebriforme]|uniref:Uncharacterized protein n=1 Tax=Glomus cerebriforme TaxID=658196 RepID=A0A397SL05_9GLOM|nr:hypothetical protein C1645_743200 [Glomus cerebriforme]